MKRWIRLGKIASVSSTAPYIVDGVKFVTNPEDGVTWAHISHGRKEEEKKEA